MLKDKLWNWQATQKLQQLNAYFEILEFTSQKRWLIEIYDPKLKPVNNKTCLANT